MKKRIVLILCIILVIIMMSGCIARPELRPQRNSDEIWVCKEIDNTYFYWDSKENDFVGVVTYKENSMNFILSQSSGLIVDFLYTTVSNQEYVSDEDSFLIGRADYQQNLMPVEITEDKLNILKGEVSTLTFVPQNKEEYFDKVTNPKDE